MKSICIKTNNSQIINYLLKSFDNINLSDTYISLYKFNHFNNIIIHHTGNELSKFYTYVSNSITKSILKYYENNLIYENINSNYFYFDLFEKKKILENTLDLISDEKNSNIRYDYINNEVFKTINYTHSFYIQAFVNFNINNYIKFINSQIDCAVNKFLIDKEYIEFVNILKLYIKSESENSKTEHLHLIYKNKTSIITDDNQNIISCTENINKAKYISDISFSSNDFALNTLLSLVPKSITIHLVNSVPDEFINTLKLIFADKIKICKDCNICSIYKIKQIKQ